MTRTATVLATASGLLLLTAGALGQEVNPARTEPMTPPAPRIIVKLRATPLTGRAQAQSADDKAAALAARTGVALKGAHALGSVLQVLELDPAQSAEEQLARIRADSGVEFASLDRRRYPHALPNDPLFSQQWYLRGAAGTPSAIDAEQAWDSTTGSDGVVIAVLDTGVRYDHPDLGRAGQGGRLLPGYDFITDELAANDGDGRDADPDDPGDYLTQAESQLEHFSGCDESNSSWHGTRVAGIIGARTNNAEGVAGATWTPWLLPVRVLGKCGGFDSDILAGMLWAAGVHVDGVPDNPYPAKIENLSLGGTGDCELSYSSVIAELETRGTVVIASVGNEGGPVGTPANCAGVVGVAGLRHVGTKVGYSSLGPEVALSAPAGNCVNLTGACLYSIATTTNSGSQGPVNDGYTAQGGLNVGTSFSAPIVSGIAGLMMAVNGNLSPAELRNRLQEGARKPFPVSSDPTVPVCHVPAGDGDVQGGECNCTADTCGAGMAYAPGGLAAALRPIAAVARPLRVTPGQTASLSAAGSAAACGRSIVSYAWESNNATTADPETTVVVPASGTVSIRLTVTDDVGRQDVANLFVSSATVTTSAPQAAGASACLGVVPLPEVGVTVVPSLVGVQAGETQSFAATVVNTSNHAVVWLVDGIQGGNATVGTISPTGLFTAPKTVSGSLTVTVSAAWSGDQSRVGTAQVTVSRAPVASSGGGGGSTGALDFLALLAVVALTSVPAAARQRPAGGSDCR